MIVYFTGTGNSRYCAAFLGEQLGDSCLDVLPLLQSGAAADLRSERPWVFVTPTYAWRLPRLVRDLIRGGRFSGSRDAYFVMTCGSEIGNAEPALRALCAEKGLEFRGVLEVVMPENYIALFSAPGEEESAAIIARAEPVLERGENHAPRHSHHRRVVAEGMNVENVRVRHGTDRKGRAQGSPVDEGRLRPEGASPVEERVRRPHAREAFAFAAFVEAVVEMFPVRREDALSFRLHLFARAAHEGFGRVVARHRGLEFREVPRRARHASGFVVADTDDAQIARRSPRLPD